MADKTEPTEAPERPVRVEGDGIWPAQCSCGHIFLEKYQWKQVNERGEIGFCWCGWCRKRKPVKPYNAERAAAANPQGAADQGSLNCMIARRVEMLVQKGSIQIEFTGRVAFPPDRPIIEVARGLAALGLRLRSTRNGLVAEPAAHRAQAPRAQEYRSAEAEHGETA